MNAAHRAKLFGWLAYAFASEVFVIVSLTLFLPICLEQFARDNGFVAPKRTEPCSTLEVTSDEGSARCQVKIGWIWVDSASFSLYTYSASVALQALTVISMGNVADHPSRRKPLLLTFAFLGSLAATLFLLLPSTSALWILAAPLAMLANVGFGASIVAMNAYLPELAREDPQMVKLRQELRTTGENEGDQDTAPLLDPAADHDDEEGAHQGVRTPDSKAYDAALSSTTSRISSLGIALGYLAGIIMLILSIIPVRQLGGSTFSLRLAIGLSGIWWAVFSVLAGFLLPSHTTSAQDVAVPDKLSIWKECKLSWLRLGRTLHYTEIMKLRNTFKYLAAWFLLSDGFTSISSTATLFAKTTLHLPSSQLIIIGILAPSGGIIGSLLWPRIQKRIRASNQVVLIILVGLTSMVPLYGCVGIWTKSGFGALRTKEEMFVLSGYFGIMYGAFQGYARASYAELIPPGEEARWYALFSITDKSSSFLGPLIVGLIADTTGNIRYAFFFLVGMIWAAVPVLAWVNMDRGRKDARGYASRGRR
ncbi:autophagy-related protein 22-like protein [Pterulicium gracile]|uniref:Autophagy-related protein n=1 Tax=Pterulicium gracile TaxID=1884261 RepID=A0A5C3Q7F4_9AGAR|nr:autophagy-related protein 22-like protein [Pterula gracilis]